MEQAYLLYTGPETRQMDGVGEFGPDCAPVAVSDSIANQYRSEDAVAAGWVVLTESEARAWPNWPNAQPDETPVVRDEEPVRHDEQAYAKE